MKKKLIRITTIPASLGGLLGGQLNFMSEHYEVVGISSAGHNYKLTKIGEKEGVRVIPVEMTRQITPIKDLKATWELYRIFRREKPFIVHTHTPKAGTLGMLAAYLARVPHRLHTIAGLPLLEATGKRRWLLDQVEKMTYAWATKIYPNSFGLKDIILTNRYTRPQKLKVLGNGSSNGINTRYFDPSAVTEEEKESLRQSLGIRPEDFVFVFVGRLVKDKGINELVRAFEKTQEIAGNVKLILVGPFEKELDPLEPETERAIASNKSIFTVGWQDDVRPYFALSDVLAFPSYREGFPNVVMQAGAMGLQSIVTDINGCNEIIVPGKNGVIIPPKDTRALATEMIRACKEPKDPARREQCRRMIVERYDQAFIWNAILKEYEALENTGDAVSRERESLPQGG
jgi:glycosyltransferase involved in cell wall biosynthesis